MTTNDDQQPSPGEEPTGEASSPLSAAEVSRRSRRYRAQTNRSDAEGLRDQMLALMDEYARQTVAARALAGDPNPTDAEPLEYVREIAGHYAQRQHRPSYLDQLADELTLDDVRVLRLAGEAAQAVTPAVVVAEAAGGKKAPEIAAEIGLTTSRVYDILRKHQQHTD